MVGSQSPCWVTGTDWLGFVTSCSAVHPQECPERPALHAFAGGKGDSELTDEQRKELISVHLDILLGREGWGIVKTKRE